MIDEKLVPKQNLKALELRLTLRLGSMTVVAAGVAAALSKLLQTKDWPAPIGAAPLPIRIA